MGAATRSARIAPLSGAELLPSAVIAHHSEILVAGTRPTATAESLIVTPTVWCTADVLGGLLAGAGGLWSRNGGVASRSAARGATGGLLMSQGLYVAWTGTQDGVDMRSAFLPVLLIAVPVDAVVAGTARLRPGLAVTSATVGGALTAVAWSVVRSNMQEGRPFIAGRGP